LFLCNPDVKEFLAHDACPLYGLASWLGYLGCSAMGDWDSLYFLTLSHPAKTELRLIKPLNLCKFP
jgi:hypothetical protein